MRSGFSVDGNNANPNSPCTISLIPGPGREVKLHRKCTCATFVNRK